VITGVVYGAAELYKRAVGERETLIRLIPLFGAMLGAVLGLVAYFAAPEIIAASNVFTAVLTGGASGLAATGGNQILKQLITKSKEDKTDEEKSD
jgi:uncharacterized membrane protein